MVVGIRQSIGVGHGYDSKRKRAKEFGGVGSLIGFGVKKQRMQEVECGRSRDPLFVSVST